MAVLIVIVKCQTIVNSFFLWVSKCQVKNIYLPQLLKFSAAKDNFFGKLLIIRKNKLSAIYNFNFLSTSKSFPPCSNVKSLPCSETIFQRTKRIRKKFCKKTGKRYTGPPNKNQHYKCDLLNNPVDLLMIQYINISWTYRVRQTFQPFIMQCPN